MAQRRDDSNYFSFAKWILSIPAAKKKRKKIWTQEVGPSQMGITNEASKIPAFNSLARIRNALTDRE